MSSRCFEVDDFLCLLNHSTFIACSAAVVTFAIPLQTLVRSDFHESADFL